MILYSTVTAPSLVRGHCVSVTPVPIEYETRSRSSAAQSRTISLPQLPEKTYAIVPFALAGLKGAFAETIVMY